MQYPICRHIKTNGVQCHAPSLTGGQWCYFHSRLHQRHTTYRSTPETRGYLIPGQHIELSPLEDRESVQVALSLVINALATGQLETRRATLLYGLQLASSNSAKLDLDPLASHVILTVQSTPEGIDLAEAGTMLELHPAWDHKHEAGFDDDDEDENEDEDEAEDYD